VSSYSGDPFLEVTEWSRRCVHLPVITAGSVTKDLQVSTVAPEPHRAVPKEEVAAARMGRTQWDIVPHVITAPSHVKLHADLINLVANDLDVINHIGVADITGGDVDYGALNPTVWALAGDGDRAATVIIAKDDLVRRVAEVIALLTDDYGIAQAVGDVAEVDLAVAEHAALRAVQVGAEADHAGIDVRSADGDVRGVKAAETAGTRARCHVGVRLR